MIILKEYPQNYELIKAKFKLKEGVVFTFGEIIYNPSGNVISYPLYKHEENHSKQQGDNPNKWWNRYLQDDSFRLSQEIPSYQIQYKEYKKVVKDRNKLYIILRKLAEDLSGDLYGNLLSFDEAIKAIKNEKLYEFRV